MSTTGAAGMTCSAMIGAAEYLRAARKAFSTKAALPSWSNSQFRLAGRKLRDGEAGLGQVQFNIRRLHPVGFGFIKVAGAFLDLG